MLRCGCMRRSLDLRRDSSPTSAHAPGAFPARGSTRSICSSTRTPTRHSVQAQRAIRGFALAYWGEAMTYHQTLWRNEDIGAARQALARLGPSPAARAAKASTADRERRSIAAVEILFGDGDADDASAQVRRRDGRSSTRAIADDPDVGALYALALLGTMSRSLIGYDDATRRAHARGWRAARCRRASARFSTAC